MIFRGKRGAALGRRRALAVGGGRQRAAAGGGRYLLYWFACALVRKLQLNIEVKWRISSTLYNSTDNTI